MTTSGSSTTCSSDFSQAHDLAAQGARTARELKALFLQKRKRTRSSRSAPAFGCGFTPRTASKTPYTSWRFDATTTRMPEFAAPGLGRESNRVTLEIECGENASGVLYSLGGAGGRRDALPRQRTSRVRIQHDDHRALRRALGRRARAPAGTRVEVDDDDREAGRAADVRSWSTAPKSRARPSSGPSPARSRRANRSTSASTSGSPVSLDYFDRAAVSVRREDRRR